MPAHAERLMFEFYFMKCKVASCGMSPVGLKAPEIR